MFALVTTIFLSLMDTNRPHEYMRPCGHIIRNHSALAKSTSNKSSHNKRKKSVSKWAKVAVLDTSRQIFDQMKENTIYFNANGFAGGHLKCMRYREFKLSVGWFVPSDQ